MHIQDFGMRIKLSVEIYGKRTVLSGSAALIADAVQANGTYVARSGKLT
jgi:hypothetical protein